MKRIICIAAVAAAALIGPASAADLNRGFADLHADRPSISWAGFYAGGHAGATLEDEMLFSTPGQNLITGFAIDEALMAGLHAGYNWQTPGGWVYGLEADVSVIDDELVSDIGTFELTEYLATLRGRIGIATGGTLLYTTAGVAFLAYDDEIGEQIGDDAVGLVVGAGLEHKFTPRLSLGIEGLYHSFSSEVGNPGEEIDIDHDFWTVRARASYHFDHGSAGLK
jgi:opacity protein-like surface antigen